MYLRYDEPQYLRQCVHLATMYGFHPLTAETYFDYKFYVGCIFVSPKSDT